VELLAGASELNSISGLRAWSVYLGTLYRVSGPGDGIMISVHTIYPLCVWVWSEASKCGTKPLGGSSIDEGGGGDDLTFPEMQGSLHSPGATSCGRMRPRPRKAGWCHGS
jgi:hypothetical protein